MGRRLHRADLIHQTVQPADQSLAPGGWRCLTPLDDQPLSALYFRPGEQPLLGGGRDGRHRAQRPRRRQPALAKRDLQRGAAARVRFGEQLLAVDLREAEGDEARGIASADCTTVRPSDLASNAGLPGRTPGAGTVSPVWASIGSTGGFSTVAPRRSAGAVLGMRRLLQLPELRGAARRQGREAMPLHTGAPVVSFSAAVASVDPADGHGLTGMPRCLLLARGFCPRRRCAQRDPGPSPGVRRGPRARGGADPGERGSSLEGPVLSSDRGLPSLSTGPAAPARPASGSRPTALTRPGGRTAAGESGRCAGRRLEHAPTSSTSPNPGRWLRTSSPPAKTPSAR